MKTSHGIPQAIAGDIILAERKIQDIQNLTVAATTLTGLRQGGIVLGLPADQYLATLQTLTKSIEEIASEGGAS